MRRMFVLAWFLGGLLAAGALAQNAPLVSTAQGKAQGKILDGGKVKAFLGLPYAAPPVGERRWKAPAAPVAWKGVRDASKFAAHCPQWPIWKDYIFDDPGSSEDCLFLNVYAPVKAAAPSKLPVMVWIHGGGYAAGSGSEPRYNGSALVERGVVVVTLDYRMNVFGFLAAADLASENHGHAGNYGLMDMVAALQWVKTNIAHFGGDPGNVTIFGESAGSFAVSTLLAVPGAQGFFQKAIGESGAAFGEVIRLDPVAERVQQDQAWVESLGAKSVAELRTWPMEKLIAAAQKLSIVRFSPVVDGEFLPDSVSVLYAAGRQAHVPTIIGWNRDEHAGTLSRGLTAAGWQAWASQHYGARTAEFLKAFPGATDEQAMRSADDFTSAGYISLGAWKWVEAQSATGRAPVYRYRFDLPAPASEMHPEGKYAFHSDELEYVFGTLETRPGSVWRPEDQRLSGQMMDYWTNFAKTGDPNGKGLPAWPRYDTTHQIQFLDRAIHAGDDPVRAEFEFLAQ